MNYRIKTVIGNMEIRTYPAYKYYITKVIDSEAGSHYLTILDTAEEAIDRHVFECKKYSGNNHD